jgi:predicted RNase H-like HicB family nuclease
MKCRILIKQDEDGVFVAECPTLPGCVSQGRSRNEALTNMQDAISGYLESLRKHNEPIPSFDPG